MSLDGHGYKLQLYWCAEAFNLKVVVLVYYCRISCLSVNCTGKILYKRFRSVQTAFVFYPCRLKINAFNAPKISLVTQNTNSFACPMCFLTVSESAPSSLLSDFQPVLPLGPFSLQTGATAAASFPQVATICCATLPALPSRRWTLNAHR